MTTFKPYSIGFELEANFVPSHKFTGKTAEVRAEALAYSLASCHNHNARNDSSISRMRVNPDFLTPRSMAMSCNFLAWEIKRDLTVATSNEIRARASAGPQGDGLAVWDAGEEDGDEAEECEYSHNDITATVALGPLTEDGHPRRSFGDYIPDLGL